MHLRRTEQSAPQRAQARRTLRARFGRITSRGPTCALGSSPPAPSWRDTAAIPQPTVPLHPWHELYRTPVATECLPNPTQHATDEAAQLVGVSRQNLSKMARE